jgi:hypothetical protein
MAEERQYDEEIAPMMLAVAKECERLGMSMVARVEWAPDQFGITQIGIGDAGIGQKMTLLAAHAKGNIDLFCIEAMKRFDCSQSAVLFHFTQRI